jgi:hypothetical protein
MKQQPQTPPKDHPPPKREDEPSQPERSGTTGEGSESALRRLREAEKRKAEGDVPSPRDKPHGFRSLERAH